MLQVKIKTIDWESAKSDMRAFISEPQRLEVWSEFFFSSLIENLLVE